MTAVVESRANAICNHPELGKCLTGIDDDPVTGSCSICCKAGGCKGAICKELKGMDPECHCLSLVFPQINIRCLIIRIFLYLNQNKSLKHEET